MDKAKPPATFPQALRATTYHSPQASMLISTRNAFSRLTASPEDKTLLEMASFPTEEQDDRTASSGPADISPLQRVDGVEIVVMRR
jgi:hypothetical protein